MDDRTLKHYNKLRVLAEPATLTTEAWEGPTSRRERRLYIEHSIAAVVQSLDARALVLANAMKPAAVAAELREAAAENRTAENTYTHATWNGIANNPSPFERRLIDMTAEQVVALVASDNEVRRARFEAFRLACAAGTATAPKEE